MKEQIKKIKPLYYVLNKVRYFRFKTIPINLYYLFCLITRRPYFGKKYGASMLNGDEKNVLDKLLNIAISANLNLNYLEIGSWAGESASVIGNKIKKFDPQRFLYCVDIWRGTGDGVIITKGNITGDKIFGLFKRNIRYSGIEEYVKPFQMTSDDFYQLNQDKFAFIYVDGDHRYTQAKKDIANYANLVAVGGILCGDDLDFLLKDVDRQFTTENKEKDIVFDGHKTYHPGVALAVDEVFQSKVGLKHSIWYIQKMVDGWACPNLG